MTIKALFIVVDQFREREREREKKTTRHLNGRWVIMMDLVGDGG